MQPNAPDGSSPAHFPTTRWSLVLRAGDPDEPLARESLAGLYGAYWYPLYAYFRRRGYDPEQARDDLSSYAEVAARVGTSEGAARVAAHRLRRRYGELLRQEIAATLAEPAEVDDEIRDLFDALET